MLSFYLVKSDASSLRRMFISWGFHGRNCLSVCIYLHDLGTFQISIWVFL